MIAKMQLLPPIAAPAHKGGVIETCLLLRLPDPFLVTWKTQGIR
jgi:hypothetical protein